MVWLARVTNYRHEYLSRIFHGHLPVTDGVRAACARALDLPETVLFHDDTPANEAAA